METRDTPKVMYEQAAEAFDKLRHVYLKNHFKDPKVMLVLGSGCGDIAKKIEEPVIVPYGTIPHMPRSTVEGHAGNLIVGHYQKKLVVAFQGRHHYYEGYSPHEASFMVYVAKHLGVRVAIMTAAGGIAPRPQFGSYEDASRYPASPGDILLIKTVDPNLLPSSMRGAISPEIGQRFNGTMDMPSLYLELLAQDVAQQRGIRLGECVYVPRQGPNYETPAEVSRLSHLSAEVHMPVVGGMSTVPELEAANALGIHTLAFAVVTNQMFDMVDRRAIEKEAKSRLGTLLNGKGATHTLSEACESVNALLKQPSHREVVESAGSKQVTENLEKLIGGVVSSMRL